MAYTTNPYCTVAQVHSVVDLTSSTDDAWIQELIDEAQAAIDRYIGYSFQTDGTVGSPVTRTYDGFDQQNLNIEYCQSFSQVIEIQRNVSVSPDGVYILGSPVNMDITADCLLGPTIRRPYTPGYTLTRISRLGFELGVQNYTVTGVFGWSQIPTEITRACTRLAGHYYAMRDTRYADQLMEQGQVKIKYDKMLPKDICEILDRYRPKLFYVR